MSLNMKDVDAVCDLVSELCGIDLDEKKSYLIENRLAELLRRDGIQSYRELVEQAAKPGARELRRDIVDRITTQETLFFRDNAPFQALQHKVLPELIDAKSATLHPKQIRIWSAACSTGQEPYSIAMTLRELLPDVDTWDVNILATDISDAAVGRASRGVYTEHEIGRGMPETLKRKYLARHADGWEISDSLRALIAFRQLNLLQPLVSLGPFEVVFCRNVAIYFTTERRRDLFDRIADVLSCGGWLFVGSSESLGDIGGHSQPEHHCRTVIYRRAVTAAS